MSSPEFRRLFLALWPSTEVRQTLVELQGRLPPGMGRPVAADNLHITLAFLGATSAERQACIAAALTDSRLAGFSFHLDHLGYWRKPQVLWAGGNAVPAGLAALVEAVSEAAARCGCRLESRPFRPHLTLLRKVSRPPRGLPLIEPIPWQAADFVLAESVTAASGVCYRIVQKWTLAPGPAGSASA